MSRISLIAWRKGWPEFVGAPDARDRKREETFLRDHARYGATIHRHTGEALAKALEHETEATKRQTLFLRLFAEYVNSLESLGALGWTIRRRDEFRLFLDGFLSYPHDAPGAFFRSVLEGSGTLVDLLALPPRGKVIQAVRDLTADGGAAREAGVWLDAGAVGLAEAAQQYFTADSVLLTHYNKAKHGATMLRLDDHTADELDFQVIAPQRDRAAIAAGSWYEIGEFRASPDLVERVRKNIEAVTEGIQQLAIITWALWRAGILYGPELSGM